MNHSWETWVNAGARGLIRRALLLAFQRRNIIPDHALSFNEALVWARDIAETEFQLLVVRWKNSASDYDVDANRSQDGDLRNTARLLIESIHRAEAIMKNPAVFGF